MHNISKRPLSDVAATPRLGTTALGDDGWHIHVPHNRGKSNVTALEYYCYRLMIRGGINHLHLSGRLFHRYIVDMYAKIEQLRLNYIKINQQKLSRLSSLTLKKTLSYWCNQAFYDSRPMWSSEE